MSDNSNSSEFSPWEEDVFNSMKDARRASPAPYLLTRINQRISNRQPLTFLEKIAVIMTRPAVAVAVLAIIILLNTLLLTTRQTTNRNDTAQNNYLNSYTASIYDIDNITP